MANSDVTSQKETTFHETTASSAVVAESKRECRNGLYMIYSSNPVNDIRNFVNSYSPIPGREAIKLMRIDYVKDPQNTAAGYKETNRTVVIMDDEAAQDLKNDGYDKRTGYDFVIVPYMIRTNNHPPKGTSYAFFVAIPEQLSNDKAREQLHAKFDNIVDVGFLAKNEYTIIFPSVSREEGDRGVYRGHSIVTFSNKVDREIIAKIKVMLDMTRWYMKNEKDEPITEFCHVAWCRNNALSNLTNSRPKNRIRNTEEAPVKTALREAKPKVATVLSENPFHSTSVKIYIFFKKIYIFKIKYARNLDERCER
jgi:hypothetical protein